MYPGGAPVRPQNISIEGSTIQDIYFRYAGIDAKKFGQRQADDENILIAYFLYYIHAPIFEMIGNDELYDKATKTTSFDELWELCMDQGIDPI